MPLTSRFHVQGKRRGGEPVVAAGAVARSTVAPVVLAELMERPEALRHAGSHVHGDLTLDVVSYADPLGQQRTLYFDRDRGHLIRSETLTAHPLLGDQTVSVVYQDYEDVDGVQVPHKLITRTGDVITAESEVQSVEFDVELDAALLAQPEDATEGAPLTAPVTVSRDLDIEERGGGLYLIPGAAPNYNVMFAVLDDGIMVLETPGTAQATTDVLRTIREAFPDTEVTRAAPTHYHFDHSGGLIGYLREGVRIVTTEGNVPFIRQVAGAQRSIGDFSQHPERSVWRDEGHHDVAMSPVAGRHTFGDGAAQVELIDVGPNPHVEEILVAWMPGIKTLFVADIYSFNGTVAPANQNLLAFAERLEELDLDVETFIPVHGQPATAEQFWELVRLGREQAQD